MWSEMENQDQNVTPTKSISPPPEHIETPGAAMDVGSIQQEVGNNTEATNSQPQTETPSPVQDIVPEEHSEPPAAKKRKVIDLKEKTQGHRPGLVIENDANRSLKLHATVMNARFRKSKTWTKTVYPFDARGIFKQYGSEEWGEYLIREAHLSQRFNFDENGYFHCCTSITFPEEMQVE